MMRAKYILIIAIIICGLSGCARNEVMIYELTSANKFCNTQAQYLHKLPIPPHRTAIDPETGVETWAWDTDVRHERRADKAAGAPYWYEGYYMDCTYEVDFDPEGNKIDARWIGGGCFNSRGQLYEPTFFYNE